MDYQVLFNIALSLAAFFGGWTLNNITRAIDRLDKDVRSLPNQYISKDDFREHLQRIETSLQRIFEKLDDKADK